MDTNREAKSQNISLTLVQHTVSHPYLVLRFLVAAGRRVAWHWFKNCIKVLIGRKASLDESGLFLRQYILHLTGLRTISKITCTGLRGEGAGSQALMVMNAINFARVFGLTYVHSPFTIIQHAERPMEEWVAAWEALFNLGSGEAVCDIYRLDAVNFSYNFNDLDRCFGWRSRGDELAHRFKAIIPEFKRKYWLNKSPRRTEQVTVAVHVRRGDEAVPDNPDYYTSNESILRTIISVKSFFDTHHVKYRICVYSQGNRADFEEFSLPGVEFFLDIDAVWTIQELIEADVLIMAKGCFSYCAGIISDGIKICEAMTMSADDLPGWRWLYLSQPESWIMSRADGSFESAAFERQMSVLIQSKAMATIRASTGSSESEI
jgi:hypothetical protein